MGVIVSKDKHIGRWVDQENLMLDGIASKTVHEDKEGDYRGKRSKTLKEV